MSTDDNSTSTQLGLMDRFRKKRDEVVEKASRGEPTLTPLQKRRAIWFFVVFCTGVLTVTINVHNMHEQERRNSEKQTVPMVFGEDRSVSACRGQSEGELCLVSGRSGRCTLDETGSLFGCFIQPK